MLRFPYLFFIITFCFLSIAKGQTLITGEVLSDDMSPISGASVMITTTENSVISFGITQKDGSFEIKVNSNLENFNLIVKALDYSDHSEFISNENQDIQILLSYENIDLKEVVIREKPIRQKRDTINYAVSAFKTEDDRVLSDLLKKLPGIEVTKSGQILYQGEPINRFYIEGMDLLGGKYNLANDNLPVDAISRVQVLENHQPIKILDDKVISNKAAINIKLKKNIAYAGTAELGGGFTPALWKTNITPMLFKRKAQLIASYQSNNIGEDITQQLKALTLDEILNNRSTQYEWIHLPQIFLPNISKERWLDNTTHLGSINFLAKLNEETDFRVNASYYNDYQKQISERSTVYFLPSDTVQLNEKDRNSFLTNYMESKFTFNRNNKNNYLFNALEIKGSWINEHGQTNDNLAHIDQKTKKPYFQVSNHFNSIKPIGKQLVEFNSEFSFLKKKTDLTIEPGRFSELLNDSIQLKANFQELEYQRIFTDNYVNFVKSYGKSFTVTPKIGGSFTHQTLESTLYNLIENTQFTQAGIDYTNDLNWKQWAAYANLDWQFRKGSWFAKLSLPFNYKNYEIDDSNFDSRINKGNFSLLPNLQIEYKPSAFWTFRFNSGFSESFGEINQLYFGYILSNHRKLSRTQTDQLPITHSFRVGGNVHYKNTMKSIFGNIGYNYIRSKKNLIYDEEMDVWGNSIVNTINQSNHAQTHLVFFKIDKYLSPIKTTISVNANLNKTQEEKILNGSYNPIGYEAISYGGKLTTAPFRWISFEYHFNLLTSKIKLWERKSDKIINQNHKFTLRLSPIKNHSVKLITDYYTNNSSSKEKNTLFSNLVYRYTISKSKIDLDAGLSNLFNKKYYLESYVSEFYKTEERIRLRPRQLFFSIHFSF